MIPGDSKIRTLSQLAGQTFTIVQPSIWKNQFELKYNEQILGTINISSWFSSRLKIKFFDKEWEIYRPGFWSSELAIKEKGKENPLATYKRKMFSREGFIHLSMGKRLKIKFGIFMSSYAIYNMMEKIIVSFRDKPFFKSNTEVKIEESSEILEDNPWVIILAWNLEQKRKRSRRSG